MFSSNGFAELTKIGENIKGTTYYADFEEIRKHNGHHYVWILSNLLKPDSDGDLSYHMYFQIDCKVFRFKNLVEIYYKEPMGRAPPRPTISKIPNGIIPTPTPQWQIYLNLSVVIDLNF